ncbi:MAG: FG-GAP-like repeat-containing protein [Pseudomonadota bacterium]
MCHLCIENSLQSWEQYQAAEPGEVPISTGKTVWSQSQVINQLASGSHWSGNNITYSFPTNTAFFPYSNSEANGFSSFNLKQTAAARLSIELWDDLIAPSFTETTNAVSSDIKFSNTSTNIGYAHAYFPGGWSGAGSVWLNPAYSSLNDPDVGEYGFLAMMHEIGHALGLNHAGNYNGGSPNYANNGSHAQDSFMYTIMSYFDAENTGADWRASDGRYYDAQTPMVHDILAIQAAYGADMTTRTGDTVYGFNSTLNSAIFDFTRNAHPVITIWDAGGNDTLDLSGFGDASIVNLAPGSYSDADQMVNNIAIAFGTVIENVVTGAGADVIYLTADAVDNVVNGNGGSDTVHVSYNFESGYSILAGSTAVNLMMSGSAGSDTLQNIEFVQFANGITVSAASLLGSIVSAGADVSNDFDGDSTSDILWYNYSALSVGQWDMSTGNPVWNGIGGASPDLQIAGTGDFDGDGTDDILWYDAQTRQVSQWAMDGGSLTTDYVGTGGAGWEIAGTGDFNGDGTDDLLWFNPQTRQVGQWEMNNGNSSWDSTGTGGAGWEIVGTGDFNGDGTDDILWFNSQTLQVGQWEMNNGNSSWDYTGQGAGGWEIAGTGDFDGDGTDDILWFNETTYEVGQWEMNNGQSTWDAIGKSAAGWQPVATGDYNGDGTDDILWHNVQTGQVGQFEMNNGNSTWEHLGWGGQDWFIFA